MYKLSIALTVALLFVFVFAIGCSNEKTEQDPGQEMTHTDDDYLLKITGDADTDFAFSIDELYEMDAVEREIVQETDEGSEQSEIRGLLLDALLSETDYGEPESIRLTASDGYSIEVPDDVLQRSEIILALQRDGKSLDEEEGPVRAFVPDEESMYWVSQLVEIEVTSVEKASTETDEILLFDTLVSSLNTEDYDGQNAVRAENLFKQVDAADPVSFVAADGFEKNEKLENVLEHVFVIDGEDAPAFRGYDLPRGMHVRDIVYFRTENTAIVSVKRSSDVFGTRAIDDHEGVAIEHLVDELNLADADSYVLEATDEYSVEILSADLEKGIVYIDADGQVASNFEDLPKNTSVKDLKSIRVLD